MKMFLALLIVCLVPTTGIAQTKPLKLTPTAPPPGEIPLQKALRERDSEDQGLLCIVKGKTYAATSEDEEKCTAMGGSLKPGVDNSAGNIKYVPYMPPPSKASKGERRPGPHDKGDPLQPDN